MAFFSGDSLMRRVSGSALLLVAFVVIISLGAYAQGISPGSVTPDGTLKLGPELWLALLGAAVTVGVNLQMLRSLRADMKTHVAKFDKLVDETLPDQYVRRDYWKEKIDSIESTLRRLDRRV